MKLLVIAWRDPAGNLREEQFEEDKFKIHTDGPWLKLFSKEKSQMVRLIPSDKVCLVQFVDQEEQPRIIRPEVVPQASRFQPS